MSLREILTLKIFAKPSPNSFSELLQRPEAGAVKRLCVFVLVLSFAAHVSDLVFRRTAEKAINGKDPGRGLFVVFHLAGADFAAAVEKRGGVV